ncbi:hypothetical protein [Streptomyces sp. H39-S7]|uniref:hypothetical protein n=1 Tax=Streptomyces sp. H39-S7 TaxID=3004357 RepID=UPI0022AFBEDE|nr:hypothetical protein [Streptomyces sp. H39-S7]MCZ4118990.1 hypothetical protein [Streptomyces sp. H39-S7]
MTEQWGTVVAALIAAAAALAGVLMGRRQVTDEAQVEHEQWLRGQRQEAYVTYLDAVDQGLTQLADIINSADRYDEAANEGHEWYEIYESIDTRGEEAWDLVRKPLERVYLLGPEKVNAAAVEVDNRLADVKTVVCFHEGDAPWPNLELYRTAKGFMDTARRGFLAVTREVIWTAPRPRRVGPWRRR